MITFLVILILVFVAVDLLVRFVVDPLILKSHKKNKVSKSFTPRFNPTIKLATETMYDGGKPHNEEESSSVTKDENLSKGASESSIQ
jgi:hypothetical protein